MKDKITILTFSADNNIGTLVNSHYVDLFGSWPSLVTNEIPIKLITNKKEYVSNQRVNNIKTGLFVSWSYNLKEALASVNTPYTLLLQDGQKITTVDESRLKEILRVLEETNGTYIEICKEEPDRFGSEMKRDFVAGTSEVLFVGNKTPIPVKKPAVWNTNQLTKLLKPDESGVEFQENIVERTDIIGVTCLMVTDHPVVTYKQENQEYWHKKNINPKKLEDFAIVISSFDKYEPLWEPNIKCLVKQWTQLLDDHDFIPIYLITNEKEYRGAYQHRVTSLKVGPDTKGDKSWSGNFVKALEQIQENSVMITLDDYMHTHIDLHRVTELLSLQKATKARFVPLVSNVTADLQPHQKTPVRGIEDVYYAHSDFGFGTDTKTGGTFRWCRMHLQDHLGDKVKILNITKKMGDVSPWEWEGLATELSMHDSNQHVVIDSPCCVRYLNVMEAGSKINMKAVEELHLLGIDLDFIDGS